MAGLSYAKVAVLGEAARSPSIGKRARAQRNPRHQKRIPAAAQAKLDDAQNELLAHKAAYCPTWGNPSSEAHGGAAASWDEAAFTGERRSSLCKPSTGLDSLDENSFTLEIAGALGKINSMSLLSRSHFLPSLRKMPCLLAIYGLTASGCVAPNGARFAPVVLPSSTLVPDGKSNKVKKQASQPRRNSLQVQLAGGARNYNEIDGTGKQDWEPNGEASVTYLRHLRHSNIDIAAVAFSNFVLAHGGGMSMRWKLRRGDRWVIAPGFSLGWAWGGVNLASALRLAPKHWIFGEIGAQFSGLGPEMTTTIGMVHRINPRFSLQYGLNHRMAFSMHASDYERGAEHAKPLYMFPTLSLSPVIHF